MVDYDKSVGTAGTMRIRDDGTTVSFIIACSDGATNVGSYTWSGVVNGQAVGGTVTLSAGFGSRTLGSWTVSSSQTVTFHQNATGTQGLGGAADHSAAINRTPPVVAPGAPGKPSVDDITATGCLFGWGAASNSPTAYYIQVSTVANFSSLVINHNTGIVRNYTATTLKPGTTYYARVIASNAAGFGPYSPVTTFRTIGDVLVSDGSAWTPAQVQSSDGSAWTPAQVQGSDGSAWTPTG